MIKESIVFIGGDKRQLYSARAFSKKGYKVYLAGFDKLSRVDNFEITDIYQGLKMSQIAVFPVTGIKGDAVPTDFSDKELKLTSDCVELLKTKAVFSGKSETITRISSEIKVNDYLKNEEFAVANALPTAEGAVQIAMEKYEGTISGSKCLVTGYGRIGKILSRLLRAMNARVSVSTDLPENFAYITADGNVPVKTSEIEELTEYNLVFNTIPALIIDENVLYKSTPDTLIIDLASMPGGVDFETADKLNIQAIHALSLPGKCSPASAGEIITDTILHMLQR